jgi:hypothetical protein
MIPAKGAVVPYVSIDRATIASDLRSYGEDELAERIRQITDAQCVQIGWAAGRYWNHFEGSAGMQLRKAVALAAVEVLEGQPRQLRRSRARSKT